MHRAMLTSKPSFRGWWKSLASVFSSDDHVIFDLNNEPHDIPATDAATLMQAGINGVRDSGATNMIFIEGTSWTGAWSEWSSFRNFLSLIITQAGSRLEIATHS